MYLDMAVKRKLKASITFWLMSELAFWCLFFTNLLLIFFADDTTDAWVYLISNVPLIIFFISLKAFYILKKVPSSPIL